MRECRAACAKGGSGHVIITDGPDTEVTREQVPLLLSALADARLPLESASYIADALIMSDRFYWKDDPIAEVVFFLSDESAPLTLAEVEQAQSRLARPS